MDMNQDIPIPLRRRMGAPEEEEVAITVATIAVIMDPLVGATEVGLVDTEMITIVGEATMNMRMKDIGHKREGRTAITVVGEAEEGPEVTPVSMSLVEEESSVERSIPVQERENTMPSTSIPKRNPEAERAEAVTLNTVSIDLDQAKMSMGATGVTTSVIPLAGRSIGGTR